MITKDLINTFPFKINFLTLVCLLSLTFGIILAVAGAVYFFFASDFSAQAEPESSNQATATLVAPATASAYMAVYVSGAVKNAGVYELESGSRINDVIALAGGFDPDADSNYIAKDLNLATIISDGLQIYVPFQVESDNSVLAPVVSDDVGPISNQVSVNHAEQQELETLPSIGSKRATDIISNRPYGALDELVSKGVISITLFEEIKQKITL